MSGGRRAKIVCTLGPATSTPDQVAGLVAAGMDVARLNMSHGSQDGHLAVYQRVRAASDASGHSVGVLVDLQGPKIRLGTFGGGPVRLIPGQEFTISVQPVPGDEHEVATTYPGLAGDVRAGDTVLVDDGRVVLEVQAVHDGRIRTRVITGGVVSDHKGLNLPGVQVSVPALTAKDEADLRWALRLRADMIALSFVQGPADAGPARKIMDEACVRLPLIAKIEKPQALDTLDEIVDAFDGIMVARGDLGVELPLEQVPMAQKRIITRARDKAKPVIVATQMLESMISAPRPTRAEASDVANAVLDGADALMLSAETSVGSYPAGAVATMARIITAAERDYLRPAASLPRAADRADHRAGHHRADYPRGRHRPGRRRGRRRGRGPRAGRVHHHRGDRAAAGPVPVTDPAAGLHPAARHPQPAGADLGSGDVHRAARPAYRRDGPPGRGRAAADRPL